jgi:pimeloyl-ACP methyl ester carboxylesterase
MDDPETAVLGGSRRDVLAGAIGLSLTAALPAAAAVPRESSRKESAMSKPSIVFSHGIWADGSCFSKLIPTLQAEGHDVIAAQYGLDTLKADVDATIAAIERVAPGPVVLVGHSYGGTVITKAGMHPRVAALVYICALGPDETETSASIQAKFPTTQVFQNIDVQNGRVWLKPVTGVPCFAGDLSEEEQGVVYATAAPPAATLFTEQVDGVAWKSKPSWYIVGAEDRAVHPDLERFCAKRMGATTTELNSSHVPMLSQPRAVLEVIHNACAAVAAKQG